jgi:hypothetical protein
MPVKLQIDNCSEILSQNVPAYKKTFIADKL